MVGGLTVSGKGRDLGRGRYGCVQAHQKSDGLLFSNGVQGCPMGAKAEKIVQYG